MKTTQTLETDNLVLFPSSKNYSLESELSDLSDPMMDLLNEFAHIKDEEIPSYLDDRFEEIEAEESITSYGSLEEYMNRNEALEALSGEDKLVKAINERMEAINEARQKIKFYLDEIEMFLPRRRV